MLKLPLFGGLSLKLFSSPVRFYFNPVLYWSTVVGDYINTMKNNNALILNENFLNYKFTNIQKEVVN